MLPAAENKKNHGIAIAARQQYSRDLDSSVKSLYCSTVALRED